MSFDRIESWIRGHDDRIDEILFPGYNDSSVIRSVDATMRAQALSAEAEGHWRTS